MKVHTDIERLPDFRNAVVTIGTFDGVHLGHQKIIGQLKSEAEKSGGETVIITFHPHPRKVVSDSPKKIQLLTTIQERIELLSAKGVDHLVIVPFTHGFSEMECNKYVVDFLKAKFNPSVVIIGYDHKFGKGRKGDYKLLEKYSAEGYFDLKEIPQQLINDSTVSSTLIRSALNEGNISYANSLLGYTFFFDGTVVRGDQRGRTIGYPTANLKIKEEDKIVPANGVYAIEGRWQMGKGNETGVWREESEGGRQESGDEKTPLTSEASLITTDSSLITFNGMMNIGVRPTVDGSTKTIEVNIFDFDKDVYGETLRIFVKDYLRPEQKFNGLDELRSQLAKDKLIALQKLK
jgi:riboflavin kinase/FMN adenylyltransferase